MEFRQLLPEVGSVEVVDLLASLELAPLEPLDRPYTIVNFISTADGRATIAGRSGPLGDEGDRAMFHGLREQVDAVMVGSGTLRTERYGRILGKSERRERRLARGRDAEPLATIVCRSNELPTEIPLFAEAEAKVIVFSPETIDLSAAEAQVELVHVERGELTLTTVMRRLRADHGVQTLLCEGGPTLFAALLHEELVDELFLTVAPKLAGGGRGPTITTGPELTEPLDLELAWLLERDGSLYLRYKVT